MHRLAWSVAPFALASAVSVSLPPAIAAEPPADKPVIAPPESWVVPTAAHDDNAPAGGPMRALLRDTQINLTKGASTTYSDVALKVLTPEGLAGLGTIKLLWNPETDRMTIHHVHILRGAQVIDVLAQGQSFTVLRREENLDRAMLDGVLTASMQVAGLQLGDAVDVAYSIRHADPATGDHHGGIHTFQTNAGDARLRIRWPSTAPVRWQETSDLPKPTITTAGGVTTLTLDAGLLHSAVLPRGAPARFQQAYRVGYTDFTDWSGVSSLMAPLYRKAATLPADGAVAKEAARIAATTTDPLARTEAALALVESEVRYQYVGLNDGGYVPADAETTWQRRFGDCKGKTVLLLALLGKLGIPADPVIVQANAAGDAIPTFLPNVGVFNHVLVRAQVAGKIYWLDGTRLGDRRLADLRVPAYHWGLPLTATGAALVPMMPAASTRLDEESRLRLDASAGIAKPVPATAEIVLRGDAATLIRRTIEAVASDSRDRALQQFWRKRYDFIEPTAVAAHFDPATGEERMTLAGTATLDWTDQSWEVVGMRIGYAADFHRDPGAHADAPFANAFPAASHNRLELVLPGGGAGFTLDPASYDASLAGDHVHREGRIANGVVTIDVSRMSVQPEWPASEAAMAEATLRHLAREHLYIHSPATKS